MGSKRLIALLLLLSQLLLVDSIDAIKIDCHPIEGATKEKCQALGCIWKPVKGGGIYQDASIAGFEPPASLSNDANFDGKSRVDEPWCFYPDTYVGYNVVKLSQYEIRLRRARPSALGLDIENLMIQLIPHNSGKLLRVRFVDLDNKRFEQELPQLTLKTAKGAELEEGNAFKVDIDRLDSRQTGPQMLTIKRSSNGAVLFSVDLTKIIFSDKFIQLNTKLSSPFVYGLGEHYDTFLKWANQYKTYSFYNTDRLTLPGGTRSYGGFPFFVNLDSDNFTNAHGIYLRNSNAMDIVLQNDLSITFRPIGGILDFFLFIGPTPLDVVSQYQQLVGLPDLPPRWSLGFHLCRYNYNSLAKTRQVWQRTRDAGIPFDVQWNDIDHMNNGNDFTYDPLNYAGLPQFVDEIHNNSMHYVMIIDPGVSQEDNYLPYSLGVEMDIFVKNATNQTLVGKVWNKSGRTVFPDFSNSRTKEYWAKLFDKFHDEVRFDGAWIDMNDISNFVDGSLDGCPFQDEPIERPPYAPGGYSLQTKSLCLSAKHKGGSEYNLHNLYAFYETIATKYALSVARPNRRTLIISRSTHPGQGHYGGHWSGDVLSTWNYLKWSIPSLLEHSMYGFNLIGSDICGFVGNTTVPLCARWSTLGAFYTFTRNHNDDVSIDQDPVALGPVVISANKRALTKRYSLLPYLYTLMHESTDTGRPVARSMAFEFFDQHDKQAMRAEDQFMWGSSLLISPIVEENSTTKMSYLPEGRWYELDITPESMSFDVDKVRVPSVVTSRRGKTQEWHKTDNIELDNLPLFHRAGSIIPVYAEVRENVHKTVTNQPIALEIALCARDRAEGSLILDDGDISDSSMRNIFKMEVDKGVLTIKMTQDTYATYTKFGRVKVYGLSIKVAKVELRTPLKTELPFKQKDHMLFFDLDGANVTISSPINVSWS